MPIYTYECKECGSIKEGYRTIKKRNNSPNCHSKMSLKIVPPMKYINIIGDGYHDVVTDTFVDSHKKRKEIMAEHNLIESG